MNGNDGALAGWISCVTVVALGWLALGNEYLGLGVAGLVIGSLLFVCVLLAVSKRPRARPAAIAEAGDVPVVKRYGQKLEALDAAGAGAVEVGGGMVEALGVAGAAEWYQEQAGVAPWDVVDVPQVKPMAVDRPLLPRRSPTLADYPLIWEVIGGTRSQNEAIRVLWGSKDGKTLAWLTRVRNLYMGEKHITRGDIIVWELGSDDDVEGVAERLGVDVDEVQAVFDGR